MKKIILVLVCAIGLVGCFISDPEYGPDYKYEFTVIIKFSDSAVDTVVFGRDSFNGNEVGLYLSDRGCLTMHCGFYRTRVACDVRTFEIYDIDRKLIRNENR